MSWSEDWGIPGLVKERADRSPVDEERALSATQPSRRQIVFATVIVVFVFGAAIAGWLLGRWWSPDEDFRLISLPAHPAAHEFSLIDGEGRHRSLADFRGRVVVIFFGFTRCPEACPTELFKLAQVMKRLGDAGKGVQVLLITLDPERDTPGLLKAYVAAFNPSFIGLTGTPEQIDRVAAAYRVAHFKQPMGSDYTVYHSTATYIIDGHGRERLLGTMTNSVEDFVHDLQQLTGGG